MPAPKPPREELLLPIRMVAMDVDGVLTDGVITWSARARGSELIETKAFHARDGLGISVARAAGLRVAWITGRSSPVVERRAAELGVTDLHQGARNKRVAIDDLMRRHNLSREQAAFVGDDLNDVPALQQVGLRVAVADAAADVACEADWVTAHPGGHGAVREVLEAILRAQGRWEAAVAEYWRRLEQEQAAGQ
jgi:3-deoxy-D-manno-octulosonate 8-phosphate phosphatase (KDO 8-P phosphatase)